MTEKAVLQARSTTDAYVSEQSAEAAKAVRELLRIGLGTSVSIWTAAPTTQAKSVSERFARLAERWRKDTRFVSSIHEMVLHPAYQQIIGMGQEALPFILRELTHHPDHWFWALHSITGVDPVPVEDRGNLAAMTRHWLRWAQEQGIYDGI